MILLVEALCLTSCFSAPPLYTKARTAVNLKNSSRCTLPLNITLTVQTRVYKQHIFIFIHTEQCAEIQQGVLWIIKPVAPKKIKPKRPALALIHFLISFFF